MNQSCPLLVISRTALISSHYFYMYTMVKDSTMKKVENKNNRRGFVGVFVVVVVVDDVTCLVIG